MKISAAFLVPEVLLLRAYTTFKNIGFLRTAACGSAFDSNRDAVRHEFEKPDEKAAYAH